MSIEEYPLRQSSKGFILHLTQNLLDLFFISKRMN